MSSPGLDRPLKTDRDLKRNVDKEIEITLFAKTNGKKKYEGILKNFDENNIVIEINGENIDFVRNKIAHIVPIIKF